MSVKTPTVVLPRIPLAERSTRVVNVTLGLEAVRAVNAESSRTTDEPVAKVVQTGEPISSFAFAKRSNGFL
jgi:hypothetical protein